MTLSLAIASLITDVDAVTGLEVKTERQEANRSGYTLVITQGGRSVASAFGRSRVTQSLDLVLMVKAPDPAAVSGMVSNINAAIIADRRRDGNAQTTTNPDEWLVFSDEGREGIELNSSVGVVVYES